MSKRYFFIFFALVLVKLLHASCMSSGIWAFPETNKIDIDGFIIVEVYGTSQDLIPKLGNDVQIHLKANDHCINLAIVEVIKGAHNISQVVFKVEQELEVGASYYLVFEDTTQIAIRKYGVWKDAVWEAAKLAKTENKPLIIEHKSYPPKIEHEGNTFMLYGCGPSMYADFRTSIMDSSLMLRAQLTELNGTDTYVYIIPIDTAGIVSLGRGMCSGAFAFQRSKKYRARFKIYDFTKTEYAYCEWIEFDSPVDYESNQFIRLVD
ncbi:MAG: hypothetical protein ACPGLV_01665 [Bacteroidia bacterium]